MKLTIEGVHFRPVHNLWFSLVTQITVGFLPHHSILFWTLRGSYL